MEIAFTTDDYQGRESSQNIVVTVSKDLQIASPITLSVIPLTIAEAITSGVPLPLNVSEDNRYSPIRAGKVVLEFLIT